MDGQTGMDGILGALGGAAGGLGGLVGEVATSLTGSQELGDLAGAAVNLLTGNIPGALVEGLALGKDVLETPCPTGGPGALGPGAAGLGPGGPPGARDTVAGRPHRAHAQGAKDAEGTHGAPAGARHPRPLHSGADAAATAPPPVVSPDPGLTGAHATSPAAPTPGFAARALADAGPGDPAHPARPAVPRGHPVRPSGPRGRPAGKATGIQAILGDGSLSIEDKVALLLSSLVDGLDGKIKTEMGQLAQAQQGGSGGKAAGDVQQLQTQLQLLVQRRAQMLTLLSNLEGLFNQTSMQVISNIR